MVGFGPHQYVFFKIVCLRWNFTEVFRPEIPKEQSSLREDPKVLVAVANEFSIGVKGRAIFSVLCKRHVQEIVGRGLMKALHPMKL